MTRKLCSPITQRWLTKWPAIANRFIIPGLRCVKHRLSHNLNLSMLCLSVLYCHRDMANMIHQLCRLWWLLFVRAWSLLVVRSIDCCSCLEPSCLSVERLSFIEAWVITALWPKCSCCLVISYVLCIVWAGCFCRTTIVMTIFWSLVCWNSVL